MHLSALVFIAFGMATQAQEAANPQLSAVKQQYESLKDQLETAESERRKALASLYDVTSRMKKITKKKGLLTDEMLLIKNNVQSLARKTVDLENHLARQKKILRRRLQLLYKLSGQSALRILFSNFSPIEFDRNLRHLKTISERDYALIKNYELNVRKYSSQRKELNAEVRRLASVEREIELQENLLSAEQHSKGQIVDKLDSTRSRYLSEIKRFKKESGVGTSLASSFYEYKGQLPSPVEGLLVSREFGFTQHPKYNYKLSHKGWTYELEKETLIRSIFKGRVAYNHFVPGYGKVVLVDHGDHYYSVYGFLTEPLVRVGDSVEQGDTIARVSRRGEPTKSFYFEIRHFNEPEDPRKWIKIVSAEPTLVN